MSLDQKSKLVIEMRAIIHDMHDIQCLYELLGIPDTRVRGELSVGKCLSTESVFTLRRQVFRSHVYGRGYRGVLLSQA